MKDPYEGIKFEKRVAQIKNKEGDVIFKEKVEFPDFFSENSVNIVTRKYLANNAKVKETSLRQMIDRVSETIAKWGKEDGYFKTDDEYEHFLYNLKFYQVHQYMAFNSPVYFNVGIEDKPQVSACFILRIEDSMESIGDIGKTEIAIFKNGSGSGINYSPLRGSTERVREGGFASGAPSFLKWHDTGAGVTKSGGTFRRSAKIAILNDDHPDIFDFIKCKIIEENKLRALKEKGINPYPGYEMKDHVYFQNTNLSVGTTNAFMKAVEENQSWSLKPRKTDSKDSISYYESFPAKDLFNKIVDAAWEIGCPGLLFLDTINKWNTCKESGDINSTNPCGEYTGFDNSACNLASLNLLKFFNKSTRHSFQFDYIKFKTVIETLITAQDILVHRASYPTPEIEKNSHELRPLGMGFSNLHSLLIYLGIPYDSERGRDLAAAITSLMTSTAYVTSENLSKIKGSFEQFSNNKEHILNILKNHKDENDRIAKKYSLKEPSKSFTHKEELINFIFNKAIVTWNTITGRYGLLSGLRNSQVTLVAPTGTISFLMGCDTFGIQPEFSFVKYKNLTEGYQTAIPMINKIFIEGLRNLGYQENEITSIRNAILSEKKPIEESGIKEEHLAVFDTEMKNGKRSLDPAALIQMMASVQPFLSGAISSTINIPNDTTKEKIYELFFMAWKMGLKGITIYRDGSKTSQVLITEKKEKGFNAVSPKIEFTKIKRNKLPKTRRAINHKFQIGGCKGYIDAGEYPNGELGEIFLTVSKQGSTLNGLLDSLAIMTSVCLQYGVPLYALVKKMIGTRFEPSGMTDNRDIRFASSIIDYIYRFLGLTYLKEDEKIKLGLIKHTTNDHKEEMVSSKKIDQSNPLCINCGQIMNKIGSCYSCLNCGESLGSCG